MDLAARWTRTFRNSKNDAFHAPLGRQSKALSRLATLLWEIYMAGSPATPRCFTDLCPLLEYHLLMKAPPQPHHAVGRWVPHFRRIDACFVALTTCTNIDLLSQSAWGVVKEWAIFFLTAFLDGSNDPTLAEVVTRMGSLLTLVPHILQQSPDLCMLVIRTFVAWPTNALWRDPEAIAPCWFLYGAAVNAILKHAQNTPCLHSVIEDNATFISTECLQLLINAFATSPMDYEVLEVHLNLLSDIIVNRTILRILIEQRAAYWVTRVLASFVKIIDDGSPITHIMASMTYRCLRFLVDAFSYVGVAAIRQSRPSRLFNTLARLRVFSSYDDGVPPSVRDPPGRPSLRFTVTRVFYQFSPFLLYKAVFRPFVAAIANVHRGRWLHDSLGDHLTFAMKMDRLRAEYGDRGKYICWNMECENSGSLCQKCSRCGVMTFCSTDCQRQHWNTGDGRELCRQLSLDIAGKEGLDTFAVPLSTAERAFLLFVMQRQLENNVSVLRQHYLQSDSPFEDGVHINLTASEEERITFRAVDSKVDAVRKEERLVWMGVPWHIQADSQHQDNRVLLGVLRLPSSDGATLIEGISAGRKRHHLLGSWDLDFCSHTEEHDTEDLRMDTQLLRLEASGLSYSLP